MNIVNIPVLFLLLRISVSEMKNVDILKPATNQSQCENITIPLCQKLGYHTTSMPNTLGHETQEEAGLEAHQFWPLIEVKCSPDFRRFICSVYAPPCIEIEPKIVLPCKNLCERARNGCEPLMQQYGFSWPLRLNCENFPTESCFDNQTFALKSVPYKRIWKPKTTQIKCENITIPLCKNLSYNSTFMPNMLGHDTQEEAGLEVHQFWPLIQVQCSPDLKLFVCSIYTPSCMENEEKVLLPCRSLCERARNGCIPLMEQYGFNWPSNFNCENFPTSKDELCIEN